MSRVSQAVLSSVSRLFCRALLQKRPIILDNLVVECLLSHKPCCRVSRIMSHQCSVLSVECLASCLTSAACCRVSCIVSHQSTCETRCETLDNTLHHTTSCQIHMMCLRENHVLYIYIYIYTYLHIDMDMDIHTFVESCLASWFHKSCPRESHVLYIHIYMHIHIYTYIWIWIYIYVSSHGSQGMSTTTEHVLSNVNRTRSKSCLARQVRERVLL